MEFKTGTATAKILALVALVAFGYCAAAGPNPILLRASIAGQEENRSTKRVLWTDSPLVFSEEVAKSPRYRSRHWQRSVYPLGNGRLGCTVFGDPRRERIQFNEDCTGGYQPFGGVYVEMPHSEYSDYRRELDISRAVQTITYASDGVRYRREYFASHPAQVMVFRFLADKAGALGGKLPGPKVGKWGQFQEWMEDIDDPQDTHRHINHMVVVHPGRQIHPTITPKLAEGAKVSLVARRDGGPGWSQAWPSGSAKGFRVRGGYELDLECKSGQLAKAAMRGISNKPGKVQVRPGEHTCTFALAKGESRVLRPSDFSSRQ